MLTAYEVAVKVSLLNGVASGLTAMSAQFAKVHGDVSKLQAGLDKIKLTMLTGGLLVGAGAAGFAMLGKAVDPAREYAHQLTQMNVAGMKQVEVARAVKEAWGAAYAVPTSNATENLAAIRELRMVFGDTSHAIANVETVQKLQAVLANTAFGGDYGRGHDAAYTVAKALEMKGAVRTPGEFNAQADAMAKAIVASGGKVTAQDFLSTFKYGRSATLGWNDTFAYQILPTLVQEMKNGGGTGGAGGPGNALMSAYAAVVGGVVPQKALKEWQKLGLLDPSKIVWTKSGEAKGLEPGGITGSTLFQANPYQWAQQVLVPAMRAAGLNTEAQQRQTLQYLFPNRTAGFVMQQLALQGWKFERDQKLIQGADGLKAYEKLLKTDPYMARMALEKQWQNILVSLGYQIMPVLIKGTLGLIEVLRPLGQWMMQHPAITKTLVLSFAALSAVMVFSGTVLLLRGAFMALSLAMGPLGGGLMAAVVQGAGLFAGVLGWVVRGVVAVLPAMGGLVALIGEFLLPITLAVGAVTALSVALYQIVKHWDSSKSIVENIKAEAGMFWNWMGDKVKWVLGLIGLKDKPQAERQANQDRRPAGFDEKAKPSANLRLVAPTVVPIMPISYVAPQAPAVDRGNFIAPAKPQTVERYGDVYLDGQKVGKHVAPSVTREQERGLERAARGSASGFDARRSLAPVGLGVA